MKHAANHKFPEIDDLGQKLMTAAVTSAYCSLGSHQRLLISQQSFQ